VKIKYLLIAAFVIVGIVAVRSFLQTDEKKVRKQFTQLAERVSKEPDESLVTTSYNIQHIAMLFADPCIFKADIIAFSGSYTPDEISGFAGRSRFYLAHLSLTFYDLNIAFLEEGVAQVMVTARVTGKTKGGDDINTTHELKTVLTETEGEWRFSQVEVVEVLQK
jgi:Flp pilus assembly pilin Flp